MEEKVSTVSHGLKDFVLNKIVIFFRKLLKEHSAGYFFIVQAIKVSLRWIGSLKSVWAVFYWESKFPTRSNGNESKNNPAEIAAVSAEPFRGRYIFLHAALLDDKFYDKKCWYHTLNFLLFRGFHSRHITRTQIRTEYGRTVPGRIFTDENIQNHCHDEEKSKII